MGSALNKRVLGDTQEHFVIDYLLSQDYDIVERNFRCRLGEIDIIARNEGYLVFVEVKYRKNMAYGHPSMAVNRRKQQTIYKVAEVYYKKNGISMNTPSRFDVVSVLGDNVEIIKNAFGGL